MQADSIPCGPLQWEMREAGLRNKTDKLLSVHGIESMLGNPFYCGIVRIKTAGEVYNGKHKPLVSGQTFETVQDIVSIGNELGPWIVAQLSPVLMAAAAVPFLSERMTIWRVGGLALGFVGVIVLFWPELGLGGGNRARLIGYKFGVLSAVFSALALIMVRGLNRTESPGAIALYFVIASMIGALFTFPWGWVVPEGRTLALLVFAGLFGGFAHIAMTLAFRFAEASRLATVEYIALLWPIAPDLLIFRLPLSTSFLLAAPLVVAGAALAAAEGRSGRTRSNA